VERVVLVHGSVTGGRATWPAQRPLRDRWELVVLTRPGFPPGPPVERVDFETDAAFVADELGDGSHLVGHSYGGVVSLLAAARRPEAIRSLTVIEPPAMDVARGRPAVDRFIAEGTKWWANGPTDDPESFLRGFLRYVGSDYEPPSPLPPELAQGRAR
jgi:pimeloyl-ACP methyl ester carboxylesterase